MYAVIASGGKQTRVAEGEQVHVELLDAEQGGEVSLRPVLLVDGDSILATPAELGETFTELVEDTDLRFRFLTNKGARVFPSSGGQTDPIDIWRARFQPRDPGAEMTDAEIPAEWRGLF